MTDFRKIGATVRDARKQRALTQAALAATLRMSRATISAIENGTFAELGARKLASVCAALGLEISVSPRSPYPTYQQLKATRDAERRS
ncbi:MAG: helix-turn-helix domain-containing protein [Aeromicrobium sp.]|nr:helix-turn-helix domain-containing protein [Burkholderiales bacterium]